MVIVWSKPSCVQCNAVKNWLNKNHIEYVEKQLLDDLEALEAFKDQGIMRAPIVESNVMDPFSGFRPDLLEAIKEEIA